LPIEEPQNTATGKEAIQMSTINCAPAKSVVKQTATRLSDVPLPDLDPHL